MKTNILITLSAISAMAGLSVHAQGTFINLDFESATLSPEPINPGTPLYVPVGSALPGWTAYLGANQQTQVIQNDYGEGQAQIDILGPNYPAAGGAFAPGVIDGNYSVLLQSGGDPQNNDVTEGVSIAQTGMVPDGSQSLEFKAWQTAFTYFSVSFDGNNLSPVVLGTGANYTLYGANIAQYSGQTGTLEFTALFNSPGQSQIGLDDITFSPVAVTPEPNTLVLTGVGGLLFALYRRFAPKQP